MVGGELVVVKDWTSIPIYEHQDVPSIDPKMIGVFHSKSIAIVLCLIDNTFCRIVTNDHVGLVHKKKLRSIEVNNL